MKTSYLTLFSFSSKNVWKTRNKVVFLKKYKARAKIYSILSQLEDAPRDLPSKVSFIPKRKSGNVQLGSGGGRG